jgi:indolepyruvate ferredoxin oxidoreductase alpha subunit
MKFLSGCDAVARGAWEGGAAFAGSYPGSPVTGIIDGLARYPEIKTQWMANEKIAMEVAVGVAHSGQSALVVMKHVGLNVAADPFFSVAYTGTRGALVIVVGDDPGAKSSQNEQDTRMLAAAAKVPVLEPANIEEALVFTRLAFAISRRFDIPVVVRVTTPLCYGTAKVVTGARQTAFPKLSFAKPLQKYLLLPSFVPNRHRDLNDRLGQLAASSWGTWFTQQVPAKDAAARYPYGIVIAGFPYAQVAEVFKGHVPLLKIGMSFPLNEAPIHEFAARCDQLLVIEESTDFVGMRLRAMGLRVASRPGFDGVGEFFMEQMRTPEIPAVADRLAAVAEDMAGRRRKRIPIAPVADFPQLSRQPLNVPPRPPGFCTGCSHRGIFFALARRDLYVVGDIGCYTLGALDPHKALDANLCMGASIGILQGYIASMGLAAARSAVAVIGDSTFFHSGIPSLLTAVAANVPATILILDNSGAAMTGYQATIRSFDRKDWERLLDAFGVPEFAVVPALDVGLIDARLNDFLASDKLSVMVLKGDCVQGLPEKGPTNYRYTIESDRCANCGDCLKVDCPAIVPVWNQDRKLASVSISNECIGCGLCAQSCPDHAIVPRTVASLGFPALTKALAPLPWERIIRTIRSIGPLARLLERFEKETY